MRRARANGTIENLAAETPADVRRSRRFRLGAKLSAAQPADLNVGERYRPLVTRALAPTFSFRLRTHTNRVTFLYKDS